ncbi:MAG TPA: helix-turn-helix domain-containing protein [Mycobacteriales bacterium]|nr:helix-turn-helix domain-containing protein [Mycobacteriales bacterium]
MHSRAWTFVDPEPVSALGQSRARVLDLLREATAPLGVQDVAGRTRLHPNTARFHLDGLVDAGLVGRTAEDRAQPGRPRMVYAALPAGTGAGRRSYRLLAEMLTGVVADAVPDAARTATDAGREWGRYLAERPAPTRLPNADEAVRQLLGILRDVGFAPEVAGDGDRRHIRLRHCPFREVAENHRDLVCGLHLGLMQGVLAELRAPLTTDRLDPFVEPSLCLAHLTDAAHLAVPGDPAGAGEPAGRSSPDVSDADS